MSAPARWCSSNDEWVPGSKAVFERFAGYEPRPEAADWLSGGKRMMFDRIEWLILPDDATKAAALQNGEVDWWENPIPDLVPLLKRNRNLNVDIADPLGNIGSFRMNHLHPPFNDVRARRAVMMALSQEDYMRAVVGDDETLWKPLPSYFTPGTPVYTEAGGDILKGPRRYDEAKKLLAEAGYKGEKIVLLRGDRRRDHQGGGRRHCRPAEADRHERRLPGAGLGHRRRPPRQEGPAVAGRLEHLPHLARRRRLHQPGALHRVRRGRRQGLVRLAELARRSRPGSAPGTTRRTWTAEKQAIADLNQRGDGLRDLHPPTGFFLQYQSWRKNVSGVVKAPFPVFWGVQKT